MDIHSLIKRAHANAKSKGWHEDREAMEQHIRKGATDDEWSIESIRAEGAISIFRNYYRTAKLMLMVGELSEAVEAIRKGDESNHAEELADVAIRLADYCGEFGIDLEAAIQAKMLINERRPYKHGKAL